MITFPLGTVGTFKALPPFDTVLPTNVKMTVDSIRTIASMAAEGVDVYEAYYKPFGISQATYTQNLNDGDAIIGLNAGKGIRYDIPSKYLDRTPNVSGIGYAHTVLIVDLGLLPETLDLVPATDRIKSIALDNLGIRASVKPAVLTPKMLIEKSIHDANEAARLAAAKANTTNETLVQDLQKQLQDAQATIAVLQHHIATHP